MSIATTNRLSAQQTQLHKIGNHDAEEERRTNDGKQPITSQLAENRIHLNAQKTYDQFEWLSEQARDYFFARAENALVSNIPGAEPPHRASKTELTLALQAVLASAAANKAQFNALLAHSFGDNYHAESAETIRQKTINGDFSWMPKIQFIEAQQLSDTSDPLTNSNAIAVGAYSAESDTIYVSQQLVNGDFSQALYVLIEETGHALDARLNTSDIDGDEGAIFARLLLGESIDSDQLLRLQSENDHGSINVDGTEIEVEFSILSNALRKAGRFVDEKIIQPIVKETVQVGRRIDDTVLQPIKEEIKRVGRQLDDSVLQPIKEATQVIARGTEALVQATLIRPVQEIWQGAKGYATTVNHLLKGKFNDAWDLFTDTTVNILTAPIRIPLEQGAILLHTTVAVLDTLRGDLNVRKLDANEITYLQGIYGNSINYSDVRIQSGGLKDELGLRANVIGNDIFMPQQDEEGQAVFNADGTMTQAGLALLGHEAAHVWQYQGDGTAYISASLIGQINYNLFKDLTGVSSPYEWYSDVASGVEFKDLRPEQQAEFAAVIGEAIVLNTTNDDTDPNVAFTEHSLAKALGIDETNLPETVYAIFIRGHAYLTDH